MKKLAAFVAALLFITILMPVNTVSAEPTFNEPSIKAKSAILIDANSGKVLFAKNENSKIYPASTTKIMTTILAIENGNLDEQYICGREVSVFSKNCSLMGLKPKEKVTIRELIYGMMLVSGNDAANAVAVAVDGSIDSFVERMNQKAQELGMENTNFVNAHGMQKDDHYSTAADMAKLAQYAMKNEEFRKFVATKSHTIASTNKSAARELINTNKLISLDPADNKYHYAYAIGIKTGLTPTAGGCLVAAARHDGMELIACIYGDTSADGVKRWGMAKNMFDYGYNYYASVDLTQILSQIKIQERIPNAPNSDIGSGVLDFVPQFEGNVMYTDTKENIAQLTASPDSITAIKAFDKELVAPIKKDERMGTVTYKLGNQLILMAPLLASRDVLDADSAPGSPSSAPASPGDPGYIEAKTKKDTSIVAIVIICVVFLVGLILLINYLVKRSKKNGQLKRRVPNNKKAYYNYRRRF
ncbi:MAG: D-alanyl-D-alanine carboxypeptidase family protein [Bacillota bacterium]|nr:D-alanyl-D-alanine carboxypeptidase family protein [Bacillota bacterium]